MIKKTNSAKAAAPFALYWLPRGHQTQSVVILIIADQPGSPTISWTVETGSDRLHPGFKDHCESRVL